MTANRKRILDLLEEGSINAPESVELLKALQTGEMSKETERILTLLVNKQLTAGEAVALINALNLAEPEQQDSKRGVSWTPSKPKPPMGMLERFSVGRILVITVQTSQSDDESDISLNLPLSLGKFVEKFIPKEALMAVQNQGIDLSEMLGTLNADVPKGELLNLEASFADNQVTVHVEVV